MMADTPKRPVIVGLTGSIGMGKSTVAQMFRDMGIPVFDADAEVHRLQGPDGALVRAIEAAFPGVTSASGVDRQALGALVLGNPAKLKQLESIIHPVVAESRAVFLAKHATADLIVFDIPLLFEKGGAENVDVVVVVSAPFAVQQQRVLHRPGMTEEKFKKIIQLQMPDAEKQVRADYVIDTGQSLGATRSAVHQVAKEIAERAIL